MARMDAKQDKMKREIMDANMKNNEGLLAEREARIEESNEKFGVLQGTLVSRIDAWITEMKA
jgi:hypothetical protein